MSNSDPTLLAAMNAVEFPIATTEIQKSFLAIRKYLLSLTNIGSFKTSTCMLGPVASFFSNVQLLDMMENKCRDEENALLDPLQAGVRPFVVVPPEPVEPIDQKPYRGACTTPRWTNIKRPLIENECWPM